MRAVLFDAYGTLLDVHGVAVLAEQTWPGSGAALSTLWRDKQLQYTWLRTLQNDYADFWQVTGEALDYAVGRLGLTMTADVREELAVAYESLPAFPDAAAVLATLAEAAMPLAVLSNGTPKMLERAFGAVRLRGHFQALLSVDGVRHYKTAPEAYQMAIDAFGGRPEEFVLVSSNGWDIAGGARFGFKTFWVNRMGAPVERLGSAPTAIGTSLADLSPWLATLQTPR
jgi:2-haloacid dehalogenase